ncbi:MAG: extradiol dioxygenase [Rhodospirillaceae bacterium]|nr:extradiol dioxygenase [Rhodospirillaceae bacterium]
MGSVRRAAVADMFYPGEAGALAAAVDAYLAAAEPEPAETALPKALIVPHAGFVYSGPVAASAYRRIAPLRDRIRRVVLLGPSHRVPFRGIAATRADAYASPLGTVMIDRAAVDRALAVPGVGILDEAHGPEHSLEVHLPFLQRTLGSFSLVPLVVGAAPPETVAAVLEALWDGPETLIVVSTDLSHYHDYETAQRIDGTTAAAIRNFDVQGIGDDQACGRVPLKGLLHLARKRGMRISEVDRRNSGDTAGSRDRVVGYGSWVLYEADDIRPRDESDTEAVDLSAHGDTLLAIARGAIGHGLRGGGSPEPGAHEDALRAPCATFVTLKRHGTLRGCIGSILAHRPLGDDVAHNAYGAAFSDPRFPRLDESEIEGLHAHISVLSAPSPIVFASEEDLLAKIRPGTDGLVLRHGHYRGVFLPAVWKQLKTPEAFLTRLKLKAGLPADYWSADIVMEHFTATTPAEGAVGERE